MIPEGDAEERTEAYSLSSGILNYLFFNINVTIADSWIRPLTLGDLGVSLHKLWYLQFYA